jgi:hypothetical protein
MPAIAVRLATIGSLMQEERLPEAAELLEAIAEQVPDSQLVVSAAQQVHFGDMLASVRASLCFPVGVDAEGEPLVCDLVQASHLPLRIFSCCAATATDARAGPSDS